jgi:integrase
VFGSAAANSPLTNRSMLDVAQAMRPGQKITVHGFRSSFRDWASEATNFPNAVVEMALAHAVGSAVEKAYRRGDLFERRRKLMDAWVAYLSKPLPAEGANVTTLHVKAV